MIGKSARDVAVITQQLYNQLVQGQLSNSAQPFSLEPPPTQMYTPTPPVPAPPIPAGISEPQRESMLGMLGAQARALAEIQYKDDFKRWGPEIDMALNVVPAAQRTPQVVDWIVRGVRGSHVNELTNEMAEAKLKQLVESGQLRPQNAGNVEGGPNWHQVDFEKLPPNYRQHLNRLGVTQNAVDEVLRKAYPNLPLSKAREKWMQSAAKGDVITDNAGHMEPVLPGDDNG